MASTAGAVRMIRQARRRQAPPETDSFEAYESQYRTILTALRRATDEPTMDRLMEWAVENVESTGTLPTPEETRAEAQRLCEDAGIEVPDDLRT